MFAPTARACRRMSGYSCSSHRRTRFGSCSIARNKGRWQLNPAEDLSPGQMEEIDRVYRDYTHLNDDSFVAENLGNWLR